MYQTVTGVKLSGIRNNFKKQKELGVFFISGSTKPKTREQIREYLNSSKSNNETVIAQTVTIDTGINIPKMKSFIFFEPPGKSFTKILQSIGRVMRKSSETKDNVYVFDPVDDFGYTEESYSMSHFWERLNYYKIEGHPVIEKEINLSKYIGPEVLDDWDNRCD